MNTLTSEDCELLASRSISTWPDMGIFETRIREVCGKEVTWTNRSEIEHLRLHLPNERDIGIYHNYVVIKTVSNLFEMDQIMTATFRRRRFVVLKRNRNLVLFDLVRILVEDPSGEMFEPEYDVPELIKEHLGNIDQLMCSKDIEITDNDIFIIGYEDFYLFGKKRVRLTDFLD